MRAIRVIGLNALYLVPGAVGGTETYAWELIRALANERPDIRYVVFVGTEAAAALESAALPPNVAVRKVPVAARIKPLRIAVELVVLPLLVWRTRVDVLHSLGTTAPLWSPGAARVVTVHDLIYHHYPNTFPRLARLALERLVPAAAQRSDRVIADSRATAEDLGRVYGVDRARIDVVPLGLGATVTAKPTPEPELRSRFSLGERDVVLCVSALLEHKNLHRLLEAFAGVERDATLVVVGHKGREFDAMRGLAESLGVADRVCFTGWVDDADLEGLYALARCFVYPSLFEGFGLPPLEAMRRGLPVACSDATSLPEVVGDAALTFDPADAGAIKEAIERLLRDAALRDDLAGRGDERASQFSWERTAAETLAVYDRAMEASSR